MAKPTSSELREQRLAAALRANLAKRKAQARAAEQIDPPPAKDRMTTG